ncbi:MAG: conserved rane protein of unknown function [Hyphomicrobiales bacterium]|nr:conserved rane protein of unknown function [Hyphomicrobiales bacterium]
MPEREPQRTPLARIARVVLGMLVVPLVLFDEAVRPLFRPLLRALARLRLLQRMQSIVAGLPPYAILVVLLVPFLIAEPLKIVALYWLGTGHVKLGIGTLVGAYAGSFVFVERIYDAGREKLMQIGWFGALMTPVTRARDLFLTWLRGSPGWTLARALARAARDRARMIAGWFRRN